jgi:hypothetical protein
MPTCIRKQHRCSRVAGPVRPILPSHHFGAVRLQEKANVGLSLIRTQQMTSRHQDRLKLLPASIAKDAFFHDVRTREPSQRIEVGAQPTGRLGEKRVIWDHIAPSL